MSEQMHAIVWDGTDYPDGLSYQVFRGPCRVPGGCWSNNRAAGICGSDLHYLLGRRKGVVPPGNLPAVLGHENAGVVVEVGSGVTSVKPGTASPWSRFTGAWSSAAVVRCAGWGSISSA